jgi:hypothetical protein
VVVVVVVLWLLNVFGVFDHLRGVHVQSSIQSPSSGKSTVSLVSQPGVVAGLRAPIRA